MPISLRSYGPQSRKDTELFEGICQGHGLTRVSEEQWVHVSRRVFYFYFFNLQLNSSVWPMCPEEKTQGLLSPEAFYCHSPDFLEKKRKT